MDDAALRERYRNAYRAYYALAMRIDERLNAGVIPSDDELIDEEVASRELSAARREWLNALFEALKNGEAGGAIGPR